MRIRRLLSAIVAVTALGFMSVATASGAEILWKWLPGSVGETFKGKTGKFTLILGSGAYSCTKSTITLSSSELLKEGSTESKDATLALALLSLEGCTAAGLSMNSTGDASGVILAHLEIHNCMIKPGAFGLLIKPLQVHLEIPATKLLELVRGAYIALVEGKGGEKLLTFKLNVKTTGGKEQEILKCEGGENDHLETAVDSETFEPNALEVKEATLEYDMTKDTVGEEMMEK